VNTNSEAASSAPRLQFLSHDPNVHTGAQAPAAEIGQSDERFRLLVEGIRDYAIFMLDPEGRVTTWNIGAERIKGYQASEILGKHFSCFYPEEDVQSGKPQWELEVAAREGRFEDEGWRVRKDGSKLWANVIITALRDEKGQLFGYGKVTRDITERKRSEEGLRQSEERFRSLVEAVQDYAIFMLDPEGRITTWNIGAERIKGYRASEILGKHFSCFYPEEDVQSGKPQWELEVAAEVGRFEDEGYRIRKDGSRFWGNVIITALRDAAGNLVGFTKVTRDFTERMLARKSLQESQRKLQHSERSLRELSLRLLRTQDEERRHIGREMHDSLGQYLSVLKMKLDSINFPPRSGSAAATKQEIATCASLAEECVKEVRTISYLLYPPFLEEMGLKSAIPWYVDGFTKRSGIKTTFEIPDDFERLSPDSELVLFRVLQESLTNVHRHSGSATADIRLLRTGETVILEVTDRGQGMPAGILEESGQDWMGAQGVGLRAMNERLQQLGGRLDISSSEAGTQVRATIPTHQSGSANTASA
jgi:PAS domain S-box-containing protein